MHRLSGRAALAWFLLTFGEGCLGFVPPPETPTPWGSTSHGILYGGSRLPDEGPGFVRARPGEDTRFGTPTMVAALTRAAREVEQAFAGSAPLRIGDLSSPLGGRHSRHRSHRNGRDADVIFYVTDTDGRSVRGRGWLAFDRYGVAREELDDPGGSGEVFLFDTARNWQLVRSLLSDDEARVQWIFCSRGVKSVLLEYAKIHEPNPEILFRASWVLHQPSSGPPHHDHFHVRIACSAEERVNGCYDDDGPNWPWLRKETEKPAGGVGEPLNDEAIVAALMSEDGETTHTQVARAESR